MTARSICRRALGVACLGIVGMFGATCLFAQTVRVGRDSPRGNPLPVSAPRTYVDVSAPANGPGSVTAVAYAWSAVPCPAAFKIKFFRPKLGTLLPTGGPGYAFLAERGPFDAQSVPLPLVPPGGVLLSVLLDPPVLLERGDLIGITALSTCGSPYLVADSGAPGALSLPGDITTDFYPLVAERLAAPVVVSAFGRTDALPLSDGRFEASLTATDPRTHAVASGFAISQTRLAGYFSLPDFTGDAFLPEVAVKMLDATRSPELGGTYWVFFAPLTDLDFELTILDRITGAVRTYRSQDAGSGQLCGGADTSAFRP